MSADRMEGSRILLSVAAPRPPHIRVLSGGLHRARDLAVDGPHEADQFAGHGDHHLLVPLASPEQAAVEAVQPLLGFPGDPPDGFGLTALAQPERGADEGAVAIGEGGLDQHATQVAAAGLGDGPPMDGIPARGLRGHQAGVAHELPRTDEAPDIPPLGDHGGGRDRVAGRAALAGACAALYWASGVAESPAAEIAILKSSTISAYDQAITGFKSTAPSGIIYSEYDLQGDLEQGRKLARKIRASDASLVVAVGLKAAVAAKLVHPERKVVTVNGDGGFLMNAQELETAARVGTAFVNVIWENGQYGSIVWKQDKKFGRHFGTDFANPDFVKLAEGFGMPAWRCDSADDFGERLQHALTLDKPSLIVLPIDYSIDVAISEELGTETVAT